MKQMIIGEIGENGKVERLFRFPKPDNENVTFPDGFDSIQIGESYPTEESVIEGQIAVIQMFVVDNMCKPIPANISIL